MPFGVSDAFLNLADREPHRALGRTAAAAGVALVGYFVAEMADEVRFGAFAWTFAVALAVGVVLGGILARGRVARWSESLRTHWTAWNEAAIGARGVADASGRVEGGRAGRGIGPAAALGTLLVVNGALAIGAWNSLPPTSVADVYGAFAFLVTATTGTYAGAAAARALVEAVWSRAVARATMDLVREGRIGVWGVR